MHFMLPALFAAAEADTQTEFWITKASEKRVFNSLAGWWFCMHNFCIISQTFSPNCAPPKAHSTSTLMRFVCDEFQEFFTAIFMPHFRQFVFKLRAREGSTNSCSFHSSCFILEKHLGGWMEDTLIFNSFEMLPWSGKSFLLKFHASLYVSLAKAIKNGKCCS